MIFNGDFAPLRDDLDDRLGAEKRIPSDGCAAFNGLEKKTRRGALIGQNQTAIGQYGRELIAHQSPGERDEVALSGE